MRRCSRALTSRIVFSRRLRSVTSMPVAIMCDTPLLRNKTVVDHEINRGTPSLVSQWLSYSFGGWPDLDCSSSDLKSSVSSAARNNSQMYFPCTSEKEYPVVSSHALLKRTIL